MVLKQRVTLVKTQKSQAAQSRDESEAVRPLPKGKLPNRKARISLGEDANLGYLYRLMPQFSSTSVTICCGSAMNRGGSA